MNEEKLEQLAIEYRDRECEDVKESLIYNPSDIRYLVQKSYEDGYRQCWELIRKQTMRKFGVSEGQGIGTSEYYQLGEYIGYELEII